MRRLAFGAAAGGAAFAVYHLAPKFRAMHAHCREMMRTGCGGAGCQPDESPRCA